MLKEILNDIDRETIPLRKTERTELLNKPLATYYNDTLGLTYSLVEHSGIPCLRVDEECKGGSTEEYVWPGGEDDFNIFVEALKEGKFDSIHRIILQLMNKRQECL